MARLQFVAVAVAALAAGCANAAKPENAALDARPDGSWITVTGQVVSRAVDRFELFDGTRRLTVEVDSYGTHTDLQPFDASLETPLAPGDRVTVSGAVDHDTYEHATIEAHIVEIHGRNARLIANPADDEGGHYGLFMTRLPPDGTPVALTGLLTLREGNTLVVDNGLYRLNVDIEDATTPPDLQVGDPVTVLGKLHSPVFGMRHLRARSVVHSME